MSFYRKYRSQKFGELIGQDHIRDTILFASKSNQIAHAYLFTGPRGTGKTSTARLVAKAVNCLNPEKSGEPCNKCDACLEITSGRALDVIEIDAASNRGIDEIRELRESVKFSPSKLKKKIYIIDEVHMLTREAFNALLKTLEEPPAHLIFILATTEAHKVPATIISRTQRFDFHRVSKKDIITNLKKIAAAEKIEADDKSLDLIAAMAEGAHRDAITLLEQAASKSKKLSIEHIETILGLAKSGEISEYLGAIFNSRTEEGLKIAHRFYREGYQLAQINITIIEWLRRILLYSVSGEIVFEETEENVAIIKKLADELKKWSDKSVQVLTQMIEIYLAAGRMFKDAAYPILPLEMATIKAGALIISNFSDLGSGLGRDGQFPISNEISNSKKEDNRTEEQTSKNVIARNGQQDVTKQSIPEKIAAAADLPAGRHGGLAMTEKKHTSDSNEAIEQSSNNNEILRPRSARAQDDDQVKVEVLEMSDDVWQAVVLETKKANSTLAALLRDSRPIIIENDLMTLGVKFKFHNDKISETKNLAILEEAIEKVMGKRIRIKCQVADLKKKPKEKLSDDDLAKAAEEIFA